MIGLPRHRVICLLLCLLFSPDFALGVAPAVHREYNSLETDRREHVAAPENCGPVVIADEDAASRSVLASFLEAAGYEVTQVVSGDEALRAARAIAPSVVLLEIPLSGFSGYEVCRTLRAEFGDELPIVFVSGSRTESYDRVAGLLVGANDYIVKPYAPDELLTRVRNLVRRSRPFAPAVAAQLTKREREVLRLLADGLVQREIAERLYISTKTVATHVEHILQKLGVRSRTQAVALAYREDLLDAIS
jgi:DNA-binding NarL/FixJ family response regulator